MERDRLGGPAGGAVGVGEVVAAVERIRVIRPEFRFPLFQRRLVQRDRLLVAAGLQVSVGEVVAGGERVAMVGTKLRFP